jgi:hypothetical protein
MKRTFTAIKPVPTRVPRVIDDELTELIAERKLRANNTAAIAAAIDKTK